MKHWTNQLEAVTACSEAVEWGRKYPTFQVAWDACANPGWMIWWLEQAYPKDRRLHEIACDFAERALRYVREGEDRPRQAIEAKRAWLRGEVTDEELAAAGVAAWAAGDAAARAAAWAAAWAAEAATWAAADAARTAVRAAAEAAAWAAAWAARTAARAAEAAERQTQCDVIRKYFPGVPSCP